VTALHERLRQQLSKKARHHSTPPQVRRLELAEQAIGTLQRLRTFTLSFLLCCAGQVPAQWC
jgi:hypothetical protein